MMARIKGLIKKYGILGLLKKALRKICSFVFWHKTLNFYAISSVRKTSIEASCPLEIRKGGWEDIDLIAGMLKDTDESVVSKRVKYLLDNGGEMFLAFSKGQLAHIAWLLYSPGICEASHSVKIKQDEAYISSCYTHHRLRGRNIYPAVLQHILEYATARNVDTYFISTDSSNIASIKGIEKAGFSFVGKLRIFRLFGKKFNNEWDSSDT